MNGLPLQSSVSFKIVVIHDDSTFYSHIFTVVVKVVNLTSYIFLLVLLVNHVMLIRAYCNYLSTTLGSHLYIKYKIQNLLAAHAHTYNKQQHTMSRILEMCDNTLCSESLTYHREKLIYQQKKMCKVAS